jgi:hypothetical protein
MTFSNDFLFIVRLIFGLALDYIRWTQLMPMIIGWAFALILVLAMALVTFQGEIDSLLARAESYAEQYFSQPPVNVTNETQVDESGSVEFTGDDIIPWILKIWGVLALAGWIFGIIRNKIFGTKPAKSLKKKIFISIAAAMIFTGTIVFLFISAGGVAGGNTFETILPFVLIPILLIIVSIWGITISHVVDMIQDALYSTDEANPKNLVKTTV